MSVKIKLELNKLSDQELVDKNTLVGTQMGKSPAIFTAPNPPLTTLIANGELLAQFMARRAGLIQEAQTLTIQIRNTRNLVEGGLQNEGTYVETLIQDLPEAQAAATAKSAGMEIADPTGTPVGPMPKVDGLMATQGDTEGEIDLAWHPVKRGLQNYLVETTDDATGQTGWRFATNSRKSTCSVSGLTSGKRYWFRVTAEGAGEPGPVSEPTTKVAP
jgi:hypothetical protein